MSVTPDGEVVTQHSEGGYGMTGEHNHNATTNGDTTSATLTLRLIMQGKEAGSIIGKKGDNVKKFREESGAKINISDSSCPERIVTVTGSTDQIFKAFTMICQKFEEDILNTHQNSNLPKPPVTIRLIVPASQCGSLIGKGGSKIKEIREVTGASVQVASEMLPNSTERAVTISGTADAITQCIYHICCVMVESPPKGATIPYRPKPSMPPVLFAGGQAFNMQPHQQYHAMPQPDPRAGMVQYAAVPQARMPMIAYHQREEGVNAYNANAYNALSKMAVQQGLLQPGVQLMGTQQALIPGMTQGLGVGGAPGAMPGFPRQPTPAAQQPPNATTHEMTIPNDLIGCIIGRGGAKINEIRQLSGATIKIANSEEGSSDRKVTITGSPDTINAAQYLINASLEMHKALTLADPSATPTSMTMNMNHMNSISHSASPMASPAPMAAIPLAQYLKPMPLAAVGAAGVQGMAIFDNLAMQKNFTTKIKGGITLQQAAAAAKSNGNKFAPY